MNPQAIGKRTMIMDDFFGEVISSYSRAQAIEDGVLVAIERDTFDGATIFKFPVAFTQALFADLRKGAGSDAETLSGRVWDVCYMATQGRMEGSDAFFKVIVGRSTLALRANCGPGDDAAPVMTIGYPEDF
jgi:hypothetical protein